MPKYKVGTKVSFNVDDIRFSSHPVVCTGIIKDYRAISVPNKETTYEYYVETHDSYSCCVLEKEILGEDEYCDYYVSDVITILEKLQEEHGNLPVRIWETLTFNSNVLVNRIKSIHLEKRHNEVVFLIKLH